ncbi:MAG: DUF309 domain-containing protein [Nitrososphaerota archaeon]|nr:DUF309 domain-containing protein [Nitrososphaerota archaeon]
MRFLVRLRAPGVPREDLLQTVVAIAKTLGADPRNPKWTSYGALELDVFTKTRDDFGLFVSAVGPLAPLEFATDLNVSRPHKEEADLFSEARELFNSERYWECHEVLEGVWRSKQGQERRLLQGVILVCAALVHHQKGNDDVAMGVLRRAAAQLDYPEGTYGGFDLARLRRSVSGMIGTGKFGAFSL